LIVGLADRADTLVALFAAGLEPTGSSDPYGLRRVALGLLQIILDRAIDLKLSALIDLAVEYSQVGDNIIRAQNEATADEGGRVIQPLLKFLEQRLRVILREEGLSHDIVDSALVALSDRPLAAATVARALTDLFTRPTFAALLEALKRADRIQPKDGR